MSVIDEIKERLDIIEVISAYVPLKKAGHNYKGLCPFHGEKTPSFVVFPDNQSWHCFGACGTGGDVFSFVMKRENLDFAETLKLLAAKAGVELQPQDGAQPAAEQHLDRLREIVANAAGYFHYLLINAGEAVIARDYLNRRGLLPDTWESWQIGYALDSWDALKDQLTHKGYTLEEIEEAGLVIRREDETGTAGGDRGCYDRFRGRLMIPIRDGQARVVGFGARVLKEDPARPQPKYMNSPQTPLFDKSNLVFGLDVARKAIRDENLAVLVEGYMDVLGSHQAGVRNVVAGMGTALTEQQLHQIKRYSSNVTLALDPDAAGVHATIRGLDTARAALEREWEPVLDPRGLVRQESRLKAQLRIASLPDGLDPDELALADVDRWRQVIANARPIVDYYLTMVGQEEDLTTAHGKDSAVARMAPLIGEIGSAVERSHYIQQLARLIQTDERVVADQLAALSRSAMQTARREAAGARKGGNGPVPMLRPTDKAAPAGGGQSGVEGRAAQQRAAVLTFGLEEHLLGHLLARPDLLAGLDAEMIGGDAPPLGAEDFAGAENQAILAALQNTQGYPTPEETLVMVLDALPAALHARCVALLERVQGQPALAEDKLSKEVADSLLRLREHNLRREINQLRFLMIETDDIDADEAADHEQSRMYHDLMVGYTAQKRNIQKLLNARTMAGALSQPSTKAIQG
jgi:DNA primase